MKNLFLALCLFPITVFAQNETIVFEDENLKSYLLLNTAVNTNSDNEIQKSEAENIRRLDMTDKNISSLVGMSFFINLEELIIEDNQISSLKPIENLFKLKLLNAKNNPIISVNLKNMTARLDVALSQTKIKNLDVSGMENLYRLEIEETPLSTVNLRGCVSLESIPMAANQLTEINLDGLPSLTYINLSRNKIKQIDVKNMPKLNYLELEDNLLENLDLTGTTRIQNLFLAGNPIAFLDVSKLTRVNFIGAERMHALKSLDVSKNTILRSLWFEDNRSLEYLNLINGNSELNPKNLTSLPNIKTICVNTERQKNNLSASYWVGTIPSFYVGEGNCPKNTLSIDENVKFKKITFYPNPVKQNLSFTEKISKIQLFSINGQKVFEADKPSNSFDIKHLESGVYIFSAISAENQKFTGKLVKK